MSQTVKALVRLRELILNGEFTPGERLLETSLVEKLDVSRTPIRAALASLAEEGLLENLPGGGYALREFSERDIQEAIDMRGAIEGFAARVAVERGVTTIALTKLKECVEQIDALLGADNLEDDDIARYLELNDFFHQQLIKLADSFVVGHMHERIVALPFAPPNAFVIAHGQMSRSWNIFFIANAQHRGIVEAIENREGARAEYLAKEHARLSLQTLRSVIQSEPALSKIPGIIQFLSS